MDRPDPEWTYADFADGEDYYRSLHEWGIEPVDRHGRGRISGDGFYASLARATYAVRQPRLPVESESFGRETFYQLYSAVAFANLIQLLLNTFVTVTWSTVGLTTDAEVNIANQRLVRRLREWCSERLEPIPHALIWVKERSGQLGLHSHLLMHLHPEHRARAGAVVQQFVETHSGRSVLKNVPRGDRIINTVWFDAPKGRGRGKDRYESEMEQLAFQWTVFKYLMKGASQNEWLTVVREERARMLLQDVAELSLRNQGLIKGKRAGSSTGLGITARLRWAEANNIDPACVRQMFNPADPHYGSHWFEAIAELNYQQYRLSKGGLEI